MYFTSYSLTLDTINFYLTVSNSTTGMNKNSILVLFDIDGTLLHPGSGARKSLSQALFEAVGQNFKIEPGFCAGKTDLLIVMDILKSGGFSEDEVHKVLDPVLDRYLELMETNYNAKKDAFVYDGVHSLISTLQNMPDVYLGLLTGNIERGARIKLEPFGLNEFLPTGAFGEDGFIRTDLSKVAVSRTESHYNVNFQPQNVVVIGDTIEDIKCGKVIQARTIAVSQHMRNDDELSGMNPDFIFRSFENKDAIIEAIVNNGSNSR